MLTTEAEFQEYCLRKLGYPVIQINLDQSQITDAITDAIYKFTEYHRDGFEVHYHTYTFASEAEAKTRVINVPTTLQIDDIVEIVTPGSCSISGRFDTQAWQAGASIMSPTGGGWSNTSLIDYTNLMNRLSDLNAVLGEIFPFRYSKWKRSVKLEFNVSNGETVCMKTYRKIDPRITGNEEAWNDLWLKSYATALIKERWGNVLSKVSGIKLVGGIEMNGMDILNSAKDEIAALEEQLVKGHQEPVDFFVG